MPERIGLTLDQHRRLKELDAAIEAIDRPRLRADLDALVPRLPTEIGERIRAGQQR